MNDMIMGCVKQLYTDSPSPVYVCDRKLNLCWSNLAGTSFLEGLAQKTESRLSLIFPDVNFTGIQELLSQGKPGEIAFAYSNNEEVSINFMPLVQDDEYAVANLVFTNAGTRNKEDTVLLPVASIYSQSYRSAMFGIFNVISVLANTFEQNEMYDELAYLNSLSYSCYSIMRSNMNVSEHYNFVHGNSKLKKERVSLNRFCKALAENISRIIASSDISFSYDIAEEPIYSLADAGKLTIALLNVIYNSCVFSDMANEIYFSLRKQGNSYVFTVSDKGVGIPPEALPYVFDPFYSDQNKSSAYAGNGLGLTVVKEIVEAHGGHCMIASEPYQGTTISMSIPIEDDPTLDRALSIPPSLYFTKRLSVENIFLAEIGKCITF